MRTNIQAPEKRVSSSLLDTHSIFLTLQGEGPYTGHRAVFVRLAGCNLQCPGCDTDYTTGRTLQHPSEIVEQVIAQAEPPCLVVITGGEPFRQDIGPLCAALVKVGYSVQIETNGTLPPPVNLDPEVVVVCSPKTGSVNKELLKRVTAFKYVLEAGSVDHEDGLPILALNHSASPKVARPPANWCGPIYVQPMDCRDIAHNLRNQSAAIKSCMDHGYIFQLQLHKLIGVE